MTEPSLFEEILLLNKSAVERGEFEVAYHLLAAALHAAPTTLERIEQVIALAEQQGSLADESGSNVSAEAAHRRGTTPLFVSLVGSAKARRAQLHADIAVRKV